MKSKFLVFILLVSFSLLNASCMSSRGGCKASQGLVGYGSRR